MRGLPMMETGIHNCKRIFIMPLIVSVFLMWFLMPNVYAYTLTTEDVCDSPVSCYSIVNCADCKVNELNVVKSSRADMITKDYGNLKGLRIENYNSTAIKVTGELIGKSAKWSIPSIGLDPWWNSTWGTCRNVTITNVGDRAINRFSAHFNISFATGLASFQDVRWVDTYCDNGGNQLYHHNVHNVTGWADEVVNVTLSSSIAGHGGTGIIALYYNNTSAVSIDGFLSANNTYIFYDGLTSNGIDRGLWCENNVANDYDMVLDNNDRFVMRLPSQAPTNSRWMYPCTQQMNITSDNVTIEFYTNITSGGDLYISWGDSASTYQWSNRGMGLISLGSGGINLGTIQWRNAGGTDTTNTMSNFDSRDVNRVIMKVEGNYTEWNIWRPRYNISYNASSNNASFGGFQRIFKLLEFGGTAWMFNISVINTTQIRYVISGIQFPDTSPPAPPTPPLITANESYSYYCNGRDSFENHTLIGVSNYTSIHCSLGCYAEQKLNCVDGRNPQCDLCLKTTIWNNNLIILGLFVGGWMVLLMFFLILRRFPMLIRLIFWMVLLIALVMLFTEYGLPSYLSQTQIDIVYAMITVSIMIIAVIGITSIMS